MKRRIVKDPDRADEYLEILDTNLGENIDRHRLITSAAIEIARKDWGKAAKFIGGLENGNIKESCLNRVFRERLGDIEEAREIIGSLSPAARVRVWMTIGKSFARNIPLRIQVVYARESTLAMMPVYARVKLTNISDKEVSVLSPVHRLGLVVTYKPTRIQGKEKKPDEAPPEKQRTHGDILIAPLYDVIALKPGDSVEKNLNMLFDYPLGFSAGSYSLKVAYSTTGVYADMYPDVWHGSISSESRFTVLEPTGADAQAYSKYKNTPALVSLNPFDRNVKKALAKLQALVSSHPDTEYAFYSGYLIGQCHYKLKNYGQAVKSFEGLIPQIGDAPYLTSAQEMLLRSYRKSGQNKKALKVLKQIDLGAKFRKSYADVLTGAVEVKPWRERLRERSETDKDNE